MGDLWAQSRKMFLPNNWHFKGILPKRTKESERMKFEYIIFEKD